MPKNERPLKRTTSCSCAMSLIYYSLISKFYRDDTPCDYVKDYLHRNLHCGDIRTHHNFPAIKLGDQ